MAQPLPKFSDMDYVKTRANKVLEKATGFMAETAWRDGHWSYCLTTIDEDTGRAVETWLPEWWLEKAADVV